TSNLSGVNESELYNYRVSGFKIYIVMQKNGVYKCLEGDASDLRDYITAGTNCSKLYVYTKNGVPEVLVIYN
ncbi:MAG: hypothetical protein IJB48_07085, partial [Clostridia bacterium]|nr:hypothetical protein [Clostridia bacterium]